MNKLYRIKELSDPKSGRSLVVDVSQGLSLGALPGLEDFDAAVQPILPLVDGIVASPGGVRLLAGRTRQEATLLVCSNWTNAFRKSEFVLPPERIHYLPLLDPVDVLDLGANAMVMQLLLGYEEQIEAQCIHQVVELALAGTAVGLPLIVDVHPSGPRVVLMSKAIELGVSYALEGGADGIAIPWPGTKSFQDILTMAAGLPVWLKPDTLDPASSELAEALDLGAAGAWLDGRPFAEADPLALIQAFEARVHASVEIA